MNLSNFEHNFIRIYKDTFHENKKKSFAVAVSGGADSLASLLLFHQFQQMFQCRLRVFHVHHGNASHNETRSYRNDAQNFVMRKAKDLGLVCKTNSINKSSKTKALESEQELRDFRYSYFKTWLQDGEILVLGHHLEDLLETQLMDLLRGSHFNHWQNFQAYYKGKFRPLWLTEKKDIFAYLKSKNQDFLQDPSNRDLSITRNWLRHEFFEKLEERLPSGKQSLFKNLQKVYKYKTDSQLIDESFFKEGACELPVTQWMLFSHSQKQRFVLKSYLNLAQASMTQGQVFEIIKKLDQSQKVIRFQTGPIFWIKTAEKIQAHRESIV